MPLFLPSRDGRGTKEEVIFELGLPSLQEIAKCKRRKLNTRSREDVSFVCMLEDKAQTNDMDDHDVHTGANKKGGVQRW